MHTYPSPTHLYDEWAIAHADSHASATGRHLAATLDLTARRGDGSPEPCRSCADDRLGPRVLASQHRRDRANPKRTTSSPDEDRNDGARARRNSSAAALSGDRRFARDPG